MFVVWQTSLSTFAQVTQRSPPKAAEHAESVTAAGLNWSLFPEGVEGWVTVASAIGPLPLSCVCRYVRFDVQIGSSGLDCTWWYCRRRGKSCWSTCAMHPLFFACIFDVWGPSLFAQTMGSCVGCCDMPPSCFVSGFGFGVPPPLGSVRNKNDDAGLPRPLRESQAAESVQGCVSGSR